MYNIELLVFVHYNETIRKKKILCFRCGKMYGLH